VNLGDSISSDLERRSTSVGRQREVERRAFTVLPESERRSSRKQAFELVDLIDVRTGMQIGIQLAPSRHVGDRLAFLGRHGTAGVASVILIESPLKTHSNLMGVRNTLRAGAAIVVAHHGDDARLRKKCRPGRNTRLDQGADRKTAAGVGLRFAVPENFSIRQDVVVVTVETHHHERSRYGFAARSIDDRARNTGRESNR
jgi:hypothetical protein